MKSIVEEIFCHAEIIPDKVAVISQHGEITYRELKKMIQARMAFIKEHGAKKGERVLLEAVPDANYVATYFAIHGVGAMAIPIQQKAGKNLVTEIIAETKPKLLIEMEDSRNTWDDCNVCTYNFLQQEEEGLEGQKIESQRIESLKTSDVADILFTSGTTSKPKGVMLTHQNIRIGAENVIEGVEMRPDDIELLGLPLYHAQALGSLRALMLKGATAVLQDGYVEWNKVYSLLREKHCTAIGLVPSALHILEELTKGKVNLMLGGLRYIEIGSAPLNMDLRKRLMEQLPDTALCINYGATESPRTIYHNLNKYPEKINAIGRPMSRVRVEIVDKDRNIIESSPDKIGTLAFWGPMNMKGYWNNPEITETVLQDGWYYSSDNGYKDKDNFIILTGRNKDIINVGGIKVSASEIENMLSIHEAVSEVACIGGDDPNEILGEVPIAFVVVRAGMSVSVQELEEYSRKNIDHHKVPRGWLFLKELPKNFMGKIDKNILRDRWNDNEK